MPISTYLNYGQPTTIRFWCLLIALLIYIIGVLGVTVLGNVPLNESLNVFTINSATSDEISIQRIKFEGPWNKWNMVRTIASIMALLLVLIACLNAPKLSPPN